MCVLREQGPGGRGQPQFAALGGEVMSYRNRNLEAERQRAPVPRWEVVDARLGYPACFWHSWGEGNAWEWSGAKKNEGVTYSLLVPTKAGRRRHSHTENPLLISTLKGGAATVFVLEGCQLFTSSHCAKAGFGLESSAPSFTLSGNFEPLGTMFRWGSLNR